MRKLKPIIVISFTLIVGFAFYYFQTKNANSTKFNLQSKNITKKYDQPDKFFEYHSDIRTGANENEPGYPFNYQHAEMQKAKKNAKVASKDIIWSERGPANVPGRTRTIVFDPDDTEKNTWFAGSVGGGIWKTTNAGESWENITSDIPNLAISTMEIAASNHDVIYAGTGEKGFNNLDAIGGGGIFKTTDRGLTWQLLESTNNNNFLSVNRLIIDPNDENIVLACTFPGSAIYRTANGGETWSAVYTSDETGVVQDLVATPGNFDVLYAGVNASGILKSADAGLSWNLVAGGFASSERIELAVANVNTDIVYASVQGTASGNNSDFYISIDAGENWNLVEESTGNHTSWLGEQGWYDNTITVSPFQDNIVYVGGIQLWRITVNGIESGNITEITKNTQHLTDAYYQIDGKNANVHVDHHFINSIIGDNENEFRLVAGCDGGIFYTEYDTDPGYADGTWTMAGMGYNTSQFYGLDKYPGAPIYMGGTQDNGTWMSPIESDSSSSWERLLGGDGYECIFHYTDPLKIIVSSQYNGFARTIDGGQSGGDATTGLIGDGPFISRLAGSKSDPEIIFAVTSYGVGRTDNFAEDWVMTVPNGNWSLRSSTDITVSIANPQIIWTGSDMTDNRNVFVSTNNGVSFEETNNFKTIGRITGLETHPENENEAFVLFSVYNQSKILRTYNLGQSWEDISGFDESSQSTGFPDVAVYSLLVMPYDTTILWAGTDIGLFESTDNGLTWAYLDNGLPAVSIWQMKIVNDQVVFATHGRGIWSATIPELSGYEPPEVVFTPSVKKLVQLISENPVVEAELNLRDIYDSTQIYFNDEYHSTIDANTETENLIQVFELNTNEDEAIIYLVSYKDGTPYYSGTRRTYLIQLKEARNEYETDFEDSYSDFSPDGMYVQWSPGFDGKAIHSAHPYEDQMETSIYLTIPIIVKEQNAIMEYKDIAIVEPGESGSVYGDNNFWDYVIVEGTKDGVNWLNLKPGYDARSNSAWLSTYNSGNDPTPDMFVQQTINLQNRFNTQDTIIIRFRLFADEAVIGWGWVIEDLKIQIPETQTEELNNLDKDLVLVYPNPSNGIFKLKTENNFGIIKSVDVFDETGRKVKSFGENTSSVDLTNYKSGIYYMKINSGKSIITKRVQIIK